ncbi:hypothetical protein T492DRAFT_896310, partial [Pavlovales sp. CCMP2436]
MSAGESEHPLLLLKARFSLAPGTAARAKLLHALALDDQTVSDVSFTLYATDLRSPPVPLAHAFFNLEQRTDALNYELPLFPTRESPFSEGGDGGGAGAQAIGALVASVRALSAMQAGEGGGEGEDYGRAEAGHGGGAASFVGGRARVGEGGEAETRKDQVQGRGQGGGEGLVQSQGGGGDGCAETGARENDAAGHAAEAEPTQRTKNVEEWASRNGTPASVVGGAADSPARALPSSRPTTLASPLAAALAEATADPRQAGEKSKEPGTPPPSQSLVSTPGSVTASGKKKS